MAGNQIGRYMLSVDDVIVNATDALNNRGYDFIDILSYEGSRSRLLCCCPRHGEFEVRYMNITRKRNATFCFNCRGQYPTKKSGNYTDIDLTAQAKKLLADIKQQVGDTAVVMGLSFGEVPRVELYDPLYRTVHFTDLSELTVSTKWFKTSANYPVVSIFPRKIV